MSRNLHLGLRNLMRNPRRTFLALLALTVGVIAIVFLKAFVAGFVVLISDVVVHGRMGALQIHRAGYLDAEEDQLKLNLPLSPELMARIRHVPGVLAVTPRITFEASLSNGQQGTMVFVTGLDPVTETAVCDQRWSMAAMKGLPRDRVDAAVLGRNLAEGMGAQVGGVVSVQASSPDGAINALDLYVDELRGNTDPLQSKRTVEMTLAHAQNLLGMEGLITEYAVAIRPGWDAAAVKVGLQTSLGPGFDVQTWKELIPEVGEGMDNMAFILSFAILFMAVLVLSGIVNTMVMTVHERVREIGSMLALGMRRSDVLRLFLAEALVLGMVGGALGGTLGQLLVEVTHITGIPLKPPGSEVDNYLRPNPDLLFTLQSMLGAWLGCVLAALQPARRAARMSPVDALRGA